jgi:hypothetical protein
MDLGPVLLGVAAVISAGSAPFTYVLGRRSESRRRNADADAVAAGAAETVRKAFSSTIDDLAAMCEAATKDAGLARASAREAQTRAAEAESNAWAAKMHAASMERFLLVLRPLIITYIPDHEPLLAQLDRLAPARTAAGSTTQ